MSNEVNKITYRPQSNSKGLPVSLKFEMVIHSNDIENHDAELQTRRQRKPDIGSAQVILDQEVSSQSRSEYSTKEVAADRDPSVESVCRMREAR